MRRQRIDPMTYPLKKGESWWIVHPNIATAEFRVPMGAITICTQNFVPFEQNMVYSILGVDNHSGWITLCCGDVVYDMPQYVFARYFDAEAFVVGRATPEELEKAKPFDYKPTVPKKLEEFVD